MKTWRDTLAALPTMTEAQVLRALEAEKEGKRRLSVLMRLHQRYGTLRLARERKELTRLAK